MGRGVRFESGWGDEMGRSEVEYGEGMSNRDFWHIFGPWVVMWNWCGLLMWRLGRCRLRWEYNENNGVVVDETWSAPKAEALICHTTASLTEYIRTNT